jgi:phosphate transport system substrate-binding protein
MNNNNLRSTFEEERKRIMKKSIVKKILLVALALALMLFALTGCGNAPSDEGSSQTDGNSTEQTEEGDASATLSGNVVIAGSTSVQPLSEVLAEAFMEANPDVKVDVQGGGSGQGIKSIEEKIADLGSLSREVKEEEKTSVTQEFVVAKDGIAVVVGKDLAIDSLTMEQLKGIFTGAIKNWKEVGGPDGNIVVVAREEGSGTRGAFNELTGVLSKDDAGKETDNTVKTAIVQPSTGAVAQAVSGAKNSIGYISLGSMNDTVKAVKVEGVDPSEAAVLDGSYKLSRPFLYVKGGDLSPQAQAYVDFVLSPEGQKIVTEEGFISAQ